VEKGERAGWSLPDEYERYTKHVSAPAHRRYLAHWLRLIHLEEAASDDYNSEVDITLITLITLLSLEMITPEIILPE